MLALSLGAPGARADVAQWDFRGDLRASNGAFPLQARKAAPAAAVGVSWTEQTLGGEPTPVARFERGTFFAARHGFPPNPVGFVDTYTVIMDVRLDTPSARRRSWRSLLQMQHTNNGDADWGINRKRRLGVAGRFGGKVIDGQWHRLALVVDAKAGTATSYINGIPASQRTRIREGNRWLLEPEFLVFADNDKENTGGWISSLQVWDEALTASAIKALGGPKADKLPRPPATSPAWSQANLVPDAAVEAGATVAVTWEPGAEPQGLVDVMVMSAAGEERVASIRQSAGRYDWRVSPFRATGTYQVTLAWGPRRALRLAPRTVRVTAGRVAPEHLGKDLIVNGNFGGPIGSHWKVIEGAPSVSEGRLSSSAAGDYRARQVVDLELHGLAKATAEELSVDARVTLGSAHPPWRFDDQAWIELTALGPSGEVLRRFVSLHDAGPKGIRRTVGGKLPTGTQRLRVDAVSRHLRGRRNTGWFDDLSVRVVPWKPTFEPRPLRITKGPMLQDVRGDVMTVLWETNLNPKAPFVEVGGAVGTPGATAAMARRAAGIETRRIDQWRYLHVARLEGLKVQSRYRYRVGADGVSSPVFQFKTAPSKTHPFRIGWMSDNQYGWRTFRKLVPKLARRSPDLAIFPGDIVQDGYDLRQWHTQWFKSLAVGDFVAKTPLVFARGNHDGEWPYAYGYSALPGFESFYSFTYGNTFIIALDTESGKYASSRQTRWLKQQLTSQAFKDAAFRIVTMHKPPYTNLWDGRHEYDGEAFVRDKWVPLFERHRVDLCVAGHAHAYERGRKRGVTYVVVGGGGGRLDDDKSGDWPFFRKLVPRYHYNIMDVDGDRLTWRAYDINERPIDRFSLKTRNRRWRQAK